MKVNNFLMSVVVSMGLVHKWSAIGPLMAAETDIMTWGMAQYIPV